MIRRKVLKGLIAQGMGRHSPDEIAELGIRDIDALATLLGDKPYLMGDAPCGADATVAGFLAAAFAPVFETEVRSAAERHVNLIAYVKRMSERYFSAEKVS
jgi:glutathione S-transferase